MTMIRVVEPENWGKFLDGFSERNAGRRARFERFDNHGEINEEGMEGTFARASVDENTLTVTRKITRLSHEREIIDRIENVRGISVQYDTDESEDMLELTDDVGNLTALHFESLVDGDS